MNISTSISEKFLQGLSSKSIKKLKVQSPNLDQIQEVRFHYHKPNHPQIVDIAGYSLRTILDRRNKTSEVKVEWVQQGNWYNPVRSSVDLPAGATDYGVIIRAWGPLVTASSPSEEVLTESTFPSRIDPVVIAQPPSSPSLPFSPSEQLPPSTAQPSLPESRLLPVGVTLPDLSRFAQFQIKEIRFQATDFDGVQPIRIVLSNPLSPSNDQMCEVTTLTLRQLLDHRAEIFGHATRQGATLSVVKWGGWSQRPERQERLHEGSTDYRAIERDWPLQRYEDLFSSHQSIEQRLYPKTSPFLPPKQPTFLSPIDLNPYLTDGSFTGPYLSVKEASFDRKQTIYISIYLSLNRKILAEIEGFTLREVLNRRDSLFSLQPNACMIQLVDQEMRELRNPVNIQSNESDYSRAEAALQLDPRSLTNFPSTSSPQPVYSAPPPSSAALNKAFQNRPFLPRVALPLLLFASLVGLAYWKRDSIRLWNTDSLSTN